MTTGRQLPEAAPVPALTGVAVPGCGVGTGAGGTACEKHSVTLLASCWQHRYASPAGACHPGGHAPQLGGGHGSGAGQSHPQVAPAGHSGQAQPVVLSPHTGGGGGGGGGQLGSGVGQLQGGHGPPAGQAHVQPTLQLEPPEEELELAPPELEPAVLPAPVELEELTPLPLVAYPLP